MKELAPLVEPLRLSTKPEDVLVLCPTGILHALPLHALEIEDGKPLLERNCVVYSASLSILHICLHRRKQQPLPESPSAIVYGNPSDDRKGGEKSAIDIAKLLGVEAKTSKKATKEAFLADCQGVDLINFYGHGHASRHASSHVALDEKAFISSLLSTDYPSPMPKGRTSMQDSIEFAGKAYLEVREIFDINLQGHVSLIACGSGEQTVELGDEPSGLITALLVAGASSVLGTLWPIADDDGRDFSVLFYQKLLERRTDSLVANLAEALRFAALSLRGRPQSNRPFNWASFVLHGAWFWERPVQRNNEMDPEARAAADG
jgi:CHAT domain-containing protein